MVLNKVKGNMYSFIGFTWNPINGECQFQCSYCYYQNNPRFKSMIKPLRLNEQYLKNNLGENNFIFIGSSTDMFAQNVPNEWIIKVFQHMRKYQNNTYLIQSKNPQKMISFSHCFPKQIIIGTTIETNREDNSSLAPPKSDRLKYIIDGKESAKTMISIEPIMDFDLDIFVQWMKQVKPEFVSIGADSHKHNLPEPSKEKVEALIQELKKFTEVKIKDNLKRLLL